MSRVIAEDVEKKNQMLCWTGCSIAIQLFQHDPSLFVELLGRRAS